MGKTLVLAEKPSVARDIAKVLGSNNKDSGCLTGPKYIVTWALGHLVTLAEPEVYSDKYKTWKIEDLPMLPDKMRLAVIRETAKQFGIVKGLLRRPDIDELIIATDAGREGELVARWILELSGFRKPIKRLWISSQTDKAVREGFANLKPGSRYEPLYHSAQCRAEADWLVGLNVTRALTCKYNAQLSAGRVQTPTLAIIAAREEEIKRFVPKDYWTIRARVNGFTLQWQDKKTGQVRIFQKDQADDLVRRLSGKSGTVTEVSRESIREMPPLAYDLTELQRDANRKFAYSAKQTLNIMQRLYEAHKLVTYPRTDSRYLTEDIVPTLKERLKSIAVGPYSKWAGELMRSPIHATKRLVDSSKVSDHHAIIPTEQFVDLGSLNREERNIYDLIIKRFIAVLSPPAEFDKTSIKSEIQGELFTAKGKTVKAAGWRVVYQDEPGTDEETDGDSEQDRDQVLPAVKKGDQLKVDSIHSASGKTRPPARYTEATLLSAMEHPGKFIENEKLREVISESSGLGTPATRADIIEKLFDSFYVERRGKEIVPTSKGIQLIQLVPEDLKSPELTAKWEQQLQLIAKGQAKPDEFTAEMRKYASRLVSTVTASNASYRHDNVTREKCPECGKYLLDVKGKKGKMLVCPDRECGYRRGVSQVSNARCPECHKKMEIRGEGENKLFACTCGYREKLSDFTNRKGDKVDKREVQKILNQQEPEVSINTALADALAKLKKQN
jgi:DNA topoisomerase-3